MSLQLDTIGIKDLRGFTVDKFTLLRHITNPDITALTHFLMVLNKLDICNCRDEINMLRNEYIDRVLKVDWSR